MEKINLKIRWPELFKKTMSPATRRKRWEQWKEIGMREGSEEMVNYWSKDNVDETCFGCKHRENDWCRWNELPCNVNPILTIQQGMIGMACMGVGYESTNEQNPERSVATDDAQ